MLQLPDYTMDFEHFVQATSVPEFSDLTAEPVKPENYTEVLKLLDNCFPSQEDRESYRISLSHVCAGRMTYLSPFVNGQISVVGYFLIRLAGTPAAFTGIHHPHAAPEGEYWLGWTGVSSEFRRRGIGSVLVQWMQEVIHHKGGTVLKISTGNTPYYSSARALYSALGFVVEPEESAPIMEAPEPKGAVIYRKQLSQK